METQATVIASLRTVLETVRAYDPRIGAILETERKPEPWVPGKAIRFPWDPECARLLSAMERCPANPNRRYVDSIIRDTVALLAVLVSIRERYPVR